MGNIYLVRHGETLWNSAMRFQGSADVELSEQGIEQAQKLAGRLRSKKFAAVYASDLKRAAQTAAIVAEGKNAPLVIEPMLREMNFGQWEGLTKNEIERDFPGIVDKFFFKPQSILVPGGETLEQVQERACKIFYALAKKHRDEDILIVSHGGVIRVILAGIFGMDLDRIWSISLYNTCLNIVSGRDNFFTVTLMNSVIHLE